MEAAFQGPQQFVMDPAAARYINGNMNAVAWHLHTAAIRSRRKLRRSDLFIANQPPKSNSPSPLESRRDDLKIAQGKRLPSIVPLTKEGV